MMPRLQDAFSLHQVQSPGQGRPTGSWPRRFCLRAVAVSSPNAGKDAGMTADENSERNTPAAELDLNPHVDGKRGRRQ